MRFDAMRFTLSRGALSLDAPRALECAFDAHPTTTGRDGTGRDGTGRDVVETGRVRYHLS
jgi:hypothetical protein